MHAFRGKHKEVNLSVMSFRYVHLGHKIFDPKSFDCGYHTVALRLHLCIDLAEIAVQQLCMYN